MKLILTHLAAYLLSAVKNNYEAKKQLKLVNFDTRLEEEIIQLKRQVEEIRSAYNLYRKRAIEDAINVLKKTQRETFLKKFFVYAQPNIKTILPLQRNKYTLKNVRHSN